MSRQSVCRRTAIELRLRSAGEELKLSVWDLDSDDLVFTRRLRRILWTLRFSPVNEDLLFFRVGNKPVLVNRRSCEERGA